MAAESESRAGVRGPRAHDIGPGGVVVVVVEADDVRIRGVDGTETRVVAPADGAGIETVAEPGRFTIRAAGAPRGVFLGVRVGARGFGVHVAGTLEVDVPRDARVEVHSASGDVAVRDVCGDVALRTASGDVSVKRAAGRIAASVASGEVSIEGVGPLALEVRSVSGDVRARAPRFDRVAIETISGDAELAGAFAPGGWHAITTVSGDVELAVAAGLTLEMKTVSGSIDCTHPDRREGDGRRRPLVIGDGAARLAVRTMSGDVELREGWTGDAPPPVTEAAPAPDGDAATLAVLEALARGEIDVAEAERRLGGAPGAGGPAVEPPVVAPPPGPATAAPAAEDARDA